MDERRTVDVLALAREAVEMAAPGGTVSVEGDAVRADVHPDGLRRAVVNLVSNADRYGQTLRVTVQAASAAVVVAVEDDGPGIADGDREEAMRPFARLDGARSNTAGNVGLGLSIVRDVARAHGGTLRLGRSDLGGLKAEIVLPQAREASRQQAGAADGRPGRT